MNVEEQNKEELKSNDAVRDAVKLNTINEKEEPNFGDTLRAKFTKEHLPALVQSIKDMLNEAFLQTEYCIVYKKLNIPKELLVESLTKEGLFVDFNKDETEMYVTFFDLKQKH